MWPLGARSSSSEDVQDSAMRESIRHRSQHVAESERNYSPRGSLEDDFDTAMNDSDNEHFERNGSNVTLTYKAQEKSSGTAEALLEKDEDSPATWSSLPRKDQLFILAFARLAEPVFATSINSYMFYMRRCFSPSLLAMAISSQAGFLSAGFIATQCLTAIVWGRMADIASVGRKNVLILGLFASILSSLGLEFSRSSATALFFRCLGGAVERQCQCSADYDFRIQP
ncbi:hypothetical protein MMC25_008034 [Agyrium rufum]|nr:hypothetical protein [Agyrium rufum]